MNNNRPLSTRFLNNLIDSNKLKSKSFNKWAFYDGMLFGSDVKWWGSGGKRKVPHEGIDLGLFVGHRGNICKLNSINVPVMFKGEAVKIEDDFIGKSIFIRHGIYNNDGMELFTIYGHTIPHDDVVPGKRIKGGGIIGNVALPGNSIKVIPHLHVSTIFVDTSIQPENLNWDMVNSSSSIELMDPFVFFQCEYVLVKH